MLKKLKNVAHRISSLRNLDFFYNEYINDVKSHKLLLGKMLINQNQQKQVERLKDVEFSVFSQWGDDGIIQHLISKINPPNKTFIEFGVETYRESNTRFLLLNDQWHGLVIDGSAAHINYIQKDPVSWAGHLYANCSFITKQNINSLLSSFTGLGYSPEIGLLSIDIDGNEWWIWNEINVVNPAIVIAEYNAVFGPDNHWTIPYEEDFNRFSRLPKGYLYYGASYQALIALGKLKGYTFVGCNGNGNNLYFVRNDKMAGLEVLAENAGFVDSAFRELWLVNLHNQYPGKKRIDFLKGEKVVDTLTGETIVIP